MANTKKEKQQEYYDEYYSYLSELFIKARDTSGLECIFTLLRVQGVEDGGWDPFVEAQEALFEFSKILRRISKRGVNKSSVRLALLIYCHSIEMSAPYYILFNLLQCIQKKSYVPFPFPGRENKKKPLSAIPQSPVVKISKIEKEANLIRETDLAKKIYSFFDDDVRNAFYHSDYTLTDKEFRICENEISRSVSLANLSEKLTRCFAFYQAFFDVYKNIRLSYRKMKKFHRLPGFEAMELITNSKEGLIGFKMYFSNGTHAFYQRRKEMVQGINVTLENDGINFFIGDFSTLRNEWYIGSKIFREMNTRYNLPGVWKPILYPAKSDEISKKISEQTKDVELGKCLFYILCTGHESIEFIVKSKNPIFDENTFPQDRFDVKLCDCSSEDQYIYDCTYFVNSRYPREIKKGINRIKKFILEYQKKGIECSYLLKYAPNPKGNVKENKDGSFTAFFAADDPRNIQCVSDFRILPRSDWKIKGEWLN